MNKLINDLIEEGYLKTPLIIDAFSEIDRIEFVQSEFEEMAEANIPLPIGHGQTISQPMTVALMMELLDPQKDQNILDVGAGSGWTTAILSFIVGPKGRVTAIERISELCELGQKNVDKFKYVKSGIAEFHQGDGSKGYEHNAPYDRILVSAVTEDIPKALKDQLKIGGKIVIPVRNDIWYLKKNGENDFYKEEYPGFSFVPLIEESR